MLEKKEKKCVADNGELTAPDTRRPVASRLCCKRVVVYPLGKVLAFLLPPDGKPSFSAGVLFLRWRNKA